MKSAIKGIVGFILIIAGLSAFPQGNIPLYIVGFLWIIAGILCFPPVMPAIENSIGAQIKQPVKYILIILIWLAGCIMMGNIPDKKTSDPAGSTATAPVASSADDNDHSGTIVLVLLGLALVAFTVGILKNIQNKKQADAFIRTMSASENHRTMMQEERPADPTPVAPAYTAQQITVTTAAPSVADEIKKLSDLYDLGQISAEEFARQKARLLS